MSSSNNSITRVNCSGNVEENAKKWADFIVKGLQPVNICRNNAVLTNINIPAVCEMDVKDHLKSLNQSVRQQIKDKLPDKFVILLDLWVDACDNSYLAIFATFPSAVECGYERVMMSIEKARSDVMDIMRYICYTVESYGKTLLNISVIVARPLKNFQDAAQQLEIPFVLCACGLLDSAAENLFRKCNVTKKCQVIMNTIAKSNCNSLLLDPVQPFIPSFVESDASSMICTIFKVRGFLKTFLNIMPRLEREMYPKLGRLDPNMEMAIAFGPIPYETMELRQLLSSLDKILLTYEEINSSNYTLKQALEKLEKFSSEMPECKYVSTYSGGAKRSKVFCDAVVKIQGGKISSLSEEEKYNVDHLRNGISRDADDPKNPKKHDPLPPDSEYAAFTKNDFMDLRCIVPTSNVCEKILKDCNYEPGVVPNGINAAAVLCQLFLKANAHLWDV